MCVYGVSLFCSPSLSVHYSQYKPLHIVKGDGLFLIDDVGTHYLDCINNVALGNEWNWDYWLITLSSLTPYSLFLSLSLLSLLYSLSLSPVGHSHPRLVQVLRQQLNNPSFKVLTDGTLRPDDRLLEDYTSKMFNTVPEANFDIILFLRSG